MALISCYECNKTISNSANSCPHCGAPSKNNFRTYSPLDTPFEENAISTEYKKVPFFIALLIVLCPILFVWLLLDRNYSQKDKKIGFIYLAISVIFFIFFVKPFGIENQPNIEPTETPYPAYNQEKTPAETVENHPIQTTAHQKSKTNIQVSALKYYADYQQNEVSADQKYKGNTLLLQGMVFGINKDYSDQVYLSILGSNNYYGIDRIHANLLPTELQTASKLVKGDIVQLICTGGTMIMGFPILDDCQIHGIDQEQHQRITGSTKYLPAKPTTSPSNNPNYTVTSQKIVTINSDERDNETRITPTQSTDNKNNSLSNEVNNELNNANPSDNMEH